MSKCYLLFAEGLEECEGLITLDILRRAGLETYTVSVQNAHTVVGAHGAHMVDADVVTDGPITTGRALGAAIPFALELVRLLTDEQTAARTAGEIVWHA